MALLLGARRAPILVAAAAVSAIIAVVCVLSAAGAFARNSGMPLTELRDARYFRESNTLARPPKRERRICEEALRQARPVGVANSHKGPDLFEQWSVTDSDVRTRRILPVYPDEPQFAPYRTAYFVAWPTLTGVDLAERTAELALSIYPGSYPKGGTAPRPFPPGTKLYLSISGGLGSGDVAVPSRLSRGSRGRVAITVPLTGSASSYPNDSYAAVLGPVDIVADVPGIGTSYYAVDLNRAARGSGVGGEIRVMQVPGVEIAFDSDVHCQTRFGLLVTRSSEDEQFVWLMATVPFLLWLLVVHSLWAQVRGGSVQSGAFDVATAAQAGVAFLAIPSLRAVLVPSEITSITRVDYLLGAELALLVLSLSVGALVAAMRRPAR